MPLEPSATSPQINVISQERKLPTVEEMKPHLERSHKKSVMDFAGGWYVFGLLGFAVGMGVLFANPIIGGILLGISIALLIASCVLFMKAKADPNEFGRHVALGLVNCLGIDVLAELFGKKIDRKYTDYFASEKFPLPSGSRHQAEDDFHVPGFYAQSIGLHEKDGNIKSIIQMVYRTDPQFLKDELASVTSLIKKRKVSFEKHSEKGLKLLNKMHFSQDRLNEQELRTLYLKAFEESYFRHFGKAADLLWTIKLHEPEEFSPLDRAQLVSDIVLCESQKKGDLLGVVHLLLENIDINEPNPKQILELSRTLSLLGEKEKNPRYKQMAQSLLVMQYSLLRDEFRSQNNNLLSEMVELLHDWKNRNLLPADV